MYYAKICISDLPFISYAVANRNNSTLSEVSFQEITEKFYVRSGPQDLSLQVCFETENNLILSRNSSDTIL